MRARRQKVEGQDRQHVKQCIDELAAAMALGAVSCPDDTMEQFGSAHC